eukprot:2380760-Rhodomonas_salina.1
MPDGKIGPDGREQVRQQESGVPQQHCGAAVMRRVRERCVSLATEGGAHQVDETPDGVADQLVSLHIRLAELRRTHA